MEIETITASLDVLKITKERLFKGKKGTYLNIRLIPSPNNKYGDDWMVVENVSKAEFDSGTKGNILGNAKIFKPTPPGADHNVNVIGEDEEEDGEAVPF